MDDQKSNAVIICLLTVLIIIYLYILLSPSQQRVSPRLANFVIQKETAANFAEFYKKFNDVQGGGDYFSQKEFYDFNFTGNDDLFWNNTYKQQHDDFFLDSYKGFDFETNEEIKDLIPSSNFICKHGWITIRSDMTYKFLWLHADERLWMGASASVDTPLHRKSFEIIPVDPDCKSGWVRLRESDMSSYIKMVSPKVNQSLNNEWVINQGTNILNNTIEDFEYHFLLEEEGFIVNRAVNACINIISDSSYSARGHSSGWRRNRPSNREYSAMMKITFINESSIDQAILKEDREMKEAKQQDEKEKALIATYPLSSEKRVISFGLYGANEKYTTGAIRNAELVKTYFPGWICRYYVTSDVPEEVLNKLKSLAAEIQSIPSGMGYASGMFWRFMVAVDPTVDRYIIRDVDSRLNARDRIAVEEWIQSGYAVHILRDHVNHCFPINGGMWGGTKNAIPDMQKLIEEWNARDEYSADLHFLEEKIWPLIETKQVAHDSYCCDRFVNTKPFPTKRPPTYQHIGQVFDAADNPRMLDIDGYIRGVPIPGSCRKYPDWIFG